MVDLRVKQVLKNRRRQLAALLGSLSLDQALLANYALLNEKRSGAGGSSRNARHKLRLEPRRAGGHGQCCTRTDRSSTPKHTINLSCDTWHHSHLGLLDLD